MKNTFYYIRESIRIIRNNLLSNLFSFLGTALILFLLGLVVALWGISSQLTHLLQSEAEISAYFERDVKNTDELLHIIQQLDGVWDVRLVNEQEAHGQMEKILGAESNIDRKSVV